MRIKHVLTFLCYYPGIYPVLIKFSWPRSDIHLHDLWFAVTFDYDIVSIDWGLPWVLIGKYYDFPEIVIFLSFLYIFVVIYLLIFLSFLYIFWYFYLFYISFDIIVVFIIFWYFYLLITLSFLYIFWYFYHFYVCFDIFIFFIFELVIIPDNSPRLVSHSYFFHRLQNTSGKPA